MRLKNPLIERYSGAAAAQYDCKRRGSARFVAEEAAFAELFEMAAPKGVLDCPIGSGRWLSYYRQVPGPILGLDISADMLRVAACKLAVDAPTDITLEEGNIFEKSLKRYCGRGIDLVVCTRFLNWFPAARAAQVFKELREVDARHAIIGASVRPIDAAWPKRLQMTWRLSYDNFKRRMAGKAEQYVHDESFLRERFSRLGWEIVAQRLIFLNSTRHNFFYFLTTTKD